jgi:hypothetical protein
MLDTMAPSSDPSTADPWSGRDNGFANNEDSWPARSTEDRVPPNTPACIAVGGLFRLGQVHRKGVCHDVETSGNVRRNLFVRLFCPCNFNLANGADYDRCRATLVFNITDGDVEGTDVSGLAVVVIADTPKAMTDGNWRLGTVIDAKASDDQAEKLQAVFSGELGGPMAALGPLVGENLGTLRAPSIFATTGCGTAYESATQRVSMSRTSSRSESRPASRRVSPASSIPPARNSG